MADYAQKKIDLGTELAKLQFDLLSDNTLVRRGESSRKLMSDFMVTKRAN